MEELWLGGPLERDGVSELFELGTAPQNHDDSRRHPHIIPFSHNPNGQRPDRLPPTRDTLRRVCRGSGTHARRQRL